MAQYYYTVAALPYLNIDSPPPLRMEEFWAFCKETISEPDWKVLESASLFGGNDLGSELLAAWHRWERALRSELARLRAAKLGMEAESIPRVVPESGKILEVARMVINETSPAQAENNILRAYWLVLEELEVNHFFDLEKLLVYSLKLQILHLKAQRNTETGTKNFTTVYHRIREQRENPILERWSTQ